MQSAKVLWRPKLAKRIRHSLRCFKRLKTGNRAPKWMQNAH
ncbi:hypothetical protein CDS [Bradyrhizobium sp.]|nr:hypothetical protein CDS [Bradyrhizobium sp.]